MEGNCLKDTAAAKVLGIAASTLRHWRQQGRGPKFLRLERSIRYRLEDLEAYLKKSKVEPSCDKRLD